MIYNEKTIMDVMGNSKDELTCSNILKFYLNPKEEHNFKGLGLNALINVLEDKKLLNKDEFNIEDAALVREYETINKNSIDIVIKSNNYVIGIENKIDAALKNDLIDYGKSLEKIAPNVIKIVLSKNKIDTMYSETGFTNINYYEFAIALEKQMENVDNKNSKWYLFLEDFITNLKGNNIEYNYLKDFSGTSEEKEEFIKQKDEEILDKIKQFVSIVKYKKDDRKEVKFNPEKSLELTAYILCNNYNFDARLTINGWTIGLNAYQNKSVLLLKNILQSNDLQIISENNQKLIIKEFDYNESIEVIANYYLQIYNILKKYQ